jgi:hypothetical protein
MPLISHAPSFLVLARTSAPPTTRLIPNGSMTTAKYKHIIDWSRTIYRETKDDAILL